MGNLVPDILSAAAEIAKIAIDAAANRLWAPVATLCYNVSMPAVFCLVPEVPLLEQSMACTLSQCHW